MQQNIFDAITWKGIQWVLMYGPLFTAKLFFIEKYLLDFQSLVKGLGR